MAYSQTQKTPGSAATEFGKKVAINGSYALIADNSTNGYLYRKATNNTWEEINTFTLAAAGTSFGSALDITDEYFIAGESAASSNTGRVGIYAISNPGASIQIFTGLANDDYFGDAIAISDNYILIGAYGADSSRGDVYLYIKGTGATWTAYSGNPITPSTRTINDLFGSAVAISGDDLIIGARGNNNTTGAVYVFKKNDETNLWEESQKIIASDGAYNDQFGESISASGNYFVVGASLAESATDVINAGAAYIYKYNTTWYEIDKLVGIDESDYEGNHFGESIDINGDYIIVGTPDVRNEGVADIFYKKRSWGHLKKIIGSDSATDDDFGKSVGISGRFIIIGSPSNGANGAIYFYEDPPIRLRLAQEFDVDREYLPSKASVYLKRVGKNITNYWPIYNTSKTAIDTTNFSTIDYGRNITTFADSLSDFTGNGYMILMGDTYSDYTTINYPVRAISPATFNLWIRCISTNSVIFQAEILLDGKIIKTITEEVSNPSIEEWRWVNTTLVLPDTREHILGIRIKESGAAIDKICIDASSIIPYSEGQEYGESPYLTVHMQVYDSDRGSPGSALYIYDYKNSITQVVQSDWYNFNINVLDDSRGYTRKNNFSGNYFLVMSCSGTIHDNFVIWEMVDNDEYMTSPSAFKF